MGRCGWPEGTWHWEGIMSGVEKYDRCKCHHTWTPHTIEARMMRKKIIILIMLIKCETDMAILKSHLSTPRPTYNIRKCPTWRLATFTGNTMTAIFFEFGYQSALRVLVFTMCRLVYVWQWNSDYYFPRNDRCMFGLTMENEAEYVSIFHRTSTIVCHMRAYNYDCCRVHKSKVTSFLTHVRTCHYIDWWKHIPVN